MRLKNKFFRQAGVVLPLIFLFCSSCVELSKVIQNRKLTIRVKNIIHETLVQDFHVNPGDTFSIEGTGFKVKVLQFIPDFYMKDGAISTKSAEPKNPAVQLELIEKEKMVKVFWVFYKYPDYNPMYYLNYDFKFELVDY